MKPHNSYVMVKQRNETKPPTKKKFLFSIHIKIHFFNHRKVDEFKNKVVYFHVTKTLPSDANEQLIFSSYDHCLDIPKFFLTTCADRTSIILYAVV